MGLGNIWMKFWWEIHWSFPLLFNLGLRLIEIYLSMDLMGGVLITVILCLFESLSSLGKINSTERGDVEVIIVFLEQVGDVATGTDSRQQISQQLLGNCLQIARVSAAGWGRDWGWSWGWGREQWDGFLWLWQRPEFPKGHRSLPWPSLLQWIFFSTYFPILNLRLVEVLSWLL